MIGRNHPRERLEVLLIKAVGCDLSPEDREELNELLKESRSARNFAVKHLLLDAIVSDFVAAESAERSYGPTQKNRRKKLARFPTQAMVWAAAAIAVGFTGLWMAGGKLNLRETLFGSEPVAIVNNANRSTLFSKGDQFEVGDWIRFERGRMALRFESGAKLAVEGPADFRIVSGNGAEMTRGRATIRVPGPIKGFTLETPSERVIDLGTSFGVQVHENGATSIAVFEGEVELQGSQHKKRGRKLHAGASVRVETGFDGTLEIPYDVSGYLGTWQTSFGVEAIEGDLRVSDPTERAMPGRVVDPDHLLLFPERESVFLKRGFWVSADSPGIFSNRGRPNRIKLEVAIEKDQIVDSYLLQFNPGSAEAAEDVTRRFTGSLRFDRPIVGLLLSAELLDATDTLLGLSDSNFTGIFRRGINVDDRVVLNADRQSLEVSFDTNQGIDQIRVLVASNPDLK